MPPAQRARPDSIEARGGIGSAPHAGDAPREDAVSLTPTGVAS